MLTRSGTDLKCCRNPPQCSETCSYFVPANSLHSLQHAYILGIRARPPRGVGILPYKSLQICRQTLREWQKELKKGALTVLSQYSESPLQEEGCFLILVLPVAAAGQQVPPEQVERGCMGKVVVCKKVL